MGWLRIGNRLRTWLGNQHRGLRLQLGLRPVLMEVKSSVGASQ